MVHKLEGHKLKVNIYVENAFYNVNKKEIITIPKSNFLKAFLHVATFQRGCASGWRLDKDRKIYISFLDSLCEAKWNLLRVW